MDDVHAVLTFLWSPPFRSIPIPEFQEKGWTFALSKVSVIAAEHEATMQLVFKGKGGPGRVAKFIVSLGAGLSPRRWSSEGLDLRVTFPLVSGDQRGVDRTPVQHAEVMMRYYLRLMNLCGIPYARAPMPHIVFEFVHGRSANDAKAIPLGRYLAKQLILEVSPDQRVRYN